jgi:mannose-1-phosphate guanylyltransferase/mannose-6-phosphate isomerase
MTIYPVILAGGSGSRLWPLSREHYPKQFLPLISSSSMLQETVRRLSSIENVASPIAVCNELHRFTLTDQMRATGVEPASVIVEPAGRNTAPALTLAALRAQQLIDKGDEDPILLVMPSDHLITDTEGFQQAIRLGASLASQGYLVTFGVVPDGPETGYGYIKKGDTIGSTDESAFRLEAFVEKPGHDTAEEYVESGQYFWNSGIFMMRAEVWLSELAYHRSDIAEVVREAYSKGREYFEYIDYFQPDLETFLNCPSDSIDYAVMEKAALSFNGTNFSPPSKTQRATGCAVVPIDVGWSDIGAWSALWQHREQDEAGNVVQGDVYTDSTKNSLLIGQHRLVATVGLEDVVVIETADAVLVARKDRVQDVKEIVQRLRDEGRPEANIHRKVHRPWGTYEVLDSGPGFQVKRLTVNPGASVSLQFHHHRAEHWVVVRGTARVTRNEEVFLLTENESTSVPKGMQHRLENPGKLPLEIIEVESGEYLGEDDIVRLQDNYDRQT